MVANGQAIAIIEDNALEADGKITCVQPIKNETRIEKISLSSCEDVQFGPKFIASTINYIDKTKKRPIRHILMILSVTILLVILSVVLVIRSMKKGIEPTPTTNPSTSPDPITETQPTDTTPNITQITPTPSLPTPLENWYEPHDKWSIKDLGTCYPIVNGISWTVAIDSNDSCNDVNDLRKLEATSGLQHNFYISQDCKAYEGYGWTCSAEYGTRYSRSNVVIAVCGQINECQEQVLELLLDKGEKSLNKNYNIIPQCCRGIAGNVGPGLKTINYLSKKFSSNNKFPNTLCGTMALCSIT